MTLLGLTFLVLLLLAVVVWAAMKGAEQSERPAAAQPRVISADSLKQSFRVALELIESNLAARAERYNLNWTLILNEGTHGRELPLVQSGLQSALSADSTLTASGQGISWNFFDHGVAIQLQADYLGAPDAEGAAANSIWDDFLGLCRNYRPDRPFDAIVLSIPADALLDADGAGQLDLLVRVKAIHRRLWLAQNRLALRFPIYIAIADCQTIPGFARFAGALPEPMRRSMLGWSSPYELSAPFQAQWVDAAMNDMVRSLSDTGAELCALEPAGSDSSAYFLLPARIERLRAGLKLFAEELMRPSAYHEPFLLRGIYLTGDCGDTALLLSTGEGPGQGGVALPFDPLGHAALALPEPGAPAPAPVFQSAQLDAVPAFLRDLFERKIFAETGLVRSASSQRMRRPAMSRVLRWSAIVLPLVWLIGLGASSVRLHHLSGQVVLYLHSLEADSRASLLANDRNALTPALSQRRALGALGIISQLDSAYMVSPFMPGSWPWFDNLSDRLQRRMEKGFADNAFEPLQRAAYARVSELTGAPLEPISGRMFEGAQCTLPLNWQQSLGAATSALNIEDLPEYNATSRYVAKLERLDPVLQAMMRLQSPAEGAASGDDMALVVRVLLDNELNGDANRIAALFRQAARERRQLDLKPLEAAASCALKGALKATTVRLFNENGLLKAEQAISASSAAVFDAAATRAEPAATLLAWQSMRTALRVQEAHLTPGKGAWMHSPALTLGPAWDSLLQRIDAVSLLGKPAVGDARMQAELGFMQFANAWDASLAKESQAKALSAGLTWSDSTPGWAFSTERKALLEGLNSLLSLPTMKFNSQASLTDVPAGATVNWDGARLDQMLALEEVRKRVQTDLLPKFPVALHGAAVAFADAGLADNARDLLSHAYAVSGPEAQAPAAEADRARALRVRAWLQDLGATSTASTLNAVLVKDALSRLQLLEDQLTRAQVFVPRERSFRSWNGEKAPLLNAFGAADPGALGAYVGQQQLFIETVGKNAEALLLQLGDGQAGNALVVRWRATMDDLVRYRLKSPTSSLMVLEQFVLTGAADIELGNCLDRLSARAAQRRGLDVFSERMQLLQAGLYSRCRELTVNSYENAWSRFADAFNRDLANRAPFRALADARTKGVAGERVLVADVDEVGAVLKLFDRVHAQALAADRDPSRPAAASNLRKVDEQMQKVREFLAPLYASEDGQAAGLDVQVEFRANALAEIDGNKIIDWALTIGGQTLHQRAAPRVLRWEPGMAVGLTLRVAQDGPVMPKAEAGHSDMRVDDRTVSYRFDDPWALFSFVSAYREAENGGNAAAARSQLLRFEFPMVAVGDNGRVTTRDSRARVFVRLTVSAPGKRSPLLWPGAFPVKVPAW